MALGPPPGHRGEVHLRRILKKYVVYYNESRPHLSLERNAPLHRNVELPSQGRVIAISQVGGLHHLCERAARGSSIGAALVLPGETSAQSRIPGLDPPTERARPYGEKSFRGRIRVLETTTSCFKIGQMEFLRCSTHTLPAGSINRPASPMRGSSYRLRVARTASGTYTAKPWVRPWLFAWPDPET